MKRCTECALLFENSLTHCPQCGRLLVKDKKSPLFFVITVLAITLAILCGVLISFSPIMAAYFLKVQIFIRKERREIVSPVFL